MNPPPRLFPIPFGEFHGCDGDGCASDPDTWPLHHVLRRGVHCRLCCSCILLSHRSLYCCRCFFLITTPSSHYDDGDTLMAPPAPTVTCQVCREAVAHLPCLYREPADGVFVCPPCTAAQNGRPFTYAPPCGRPLDQSDARVLVLAARIALALLQRHATTARAAAERLAREAVDAHTRAKVALDTAFDLIEKEANPSWVAPESPENDLAASEVDRTEADQANVGEVLLPLLNAMPPLAMLTIGTGASVVPPPSSSSQSKMLFDLNESAPENEAEAAQAEPKLHCALNSNMKEVAMSFAEAARARPPPPPPQTLNSFNVKVAMAAAEAARARPPARQMLQLFPSAKASSSTKKPRTKKPRALQLFNDDDDDDDDEVIELDAAKLLK